MTAFWITCPLSQHNYRIQITLPQQPPPPHGYNTVYMLDGDWSMDALRATAQYPDYPVALIAIGYGPDLAISRAARAYDYTPSIYSTTQAECDPRMPQWRSGGADTFLAFLAHTLIPRIEAELQANPAGRTLYGHSYGGLFVLHTLYQQPALFRRYVAASPSLWWREQHLIHTADQLSHTAMAHSTELLIMVGEGEAWHPLPAGADPADPDRRHGIPTLPMAQALIKRLQTVPGLSITLETLPGLQHAHVLSRSAARAISFADSTENDKNLLDTHRY